MYRSVKKTFAIILAALLAVSAFAGCTDRAETGESGSNESSQVIIDESPEEERPSLEEAAANNRLMDEDAITLVQLQTPGPDDEVAVLKTNMGQMVIALYPDEAPLAVENFKNLATEGFYNGKVFHFVREGYLVQGGAVNSNGTGSKSSFTNAQGDQELFEVENSWNMWNFRGAVSMVSNSDHLNGSQFVIIHSEEIYKYEAADLAEAKFPQKVIDAYSDIGGVPHRDGYDTVFGMVVQGLDVLDEMVGVSKDVSGMPDEPILIESVTIEKYGEVDLGENNSPS